MRKNNGSTIALLVVTLMFLVTSVGYAQEQSKEQQPPAKKKPLSMDMNDVSKETPSNSTTSTTSTTSTENLNKEESTPFTIDKAWENLGYFLGFDAAIVGEKNLTREGTTAFRFYVTNQDKTGAAVGNFFITDRDGLRAFYGGLEKANRTESFSEVIKLKSIDKNSVLTIYSTKQGSGIGIQTIRNKSVVCVLTPRENENLQRALLNLILKEF